MSFFNRHESYSNVVVSISFLVSQYYYFNYQCETFVFFQQTWILFKCGRFYFFFLISQYCYFNHQCETFIFLQHTWILFKYRRFYFFSLFLNIIITFADFAIQLVKSSPDLAKCSSNGSSPLALLATKTCAFIGTNTLNSPKRLSCEFHFSICIFCSHLKHITTCKCNY